MLYGKTIRSPKSRQYLDSNKNKTNIKLNALRQNGQKPSKSRSLINKKQDITKLDRYLSDGFRRPTYKTAKNERARLAEDSDAPLERVK